MTPAELAVLRDKVTRAKLKRSGNLRLHVRAGWTPEREAAGNAALAALHEAECRNGKRGDAKGRGGARERLVVVPAGNAKPVAGRPQPARAARRPCVYCAGESLPGPWPHTCYGHSDLPRLDDAYVGELLLRGIA